MWSSQKNINIYSINHLYVIFHDHDFVKLWGNLVGQFKELFFFQKCSDTNSQFLLPTSDMISNSCRMYVFNSYWQNTTAHAYKIFSKFFWTCFSFQTVSSEELQELGGKVFQAISDCTVPRRIALAFVMPHKSKHLTHFCAGGVSYLTWFRCRMIWHILQKYSKNSAVKCSLYRVTFCLHFVVCSETKSPPLPYTSVISSHVLMLSTSFT